MNLAKSNYDVSESDKEFYSKVTRKMIRQIYTHFKIDFLAFGYNKTYDDYYSLGKLKETKEDKDKKSKYYL